MEDHIQSSIAQTQSLPALRDRVFGEAEPVTVSICTITYNHAAFIRDCLEGFLDQAAPFRIEVVIYDDASTDGTSEIVMEYAERHPTIFRTFLKQENLFSKGVNPYYAYVFPAAQGKYIAICDGDDYWQDPAKLATQMRVLEEDPETVITYGPVTAEIDGQLVRGFKNGVEHDVTALALKTGVGINTLTTCFRNPFFPGPPAFLRNSPIGDLTVWAHLGHSGKGRYLPNLLPAVYRIHDGGVLSKKSRDHAFYMRVIAHLCIAGYQNSRADRRAEGELLAKGAWMIARHVGVFKLLRQLVQMKLRERFGPRSRQGL